MPPSPHQRIIQQVARATLGPAGLRQRGRSRCWLDDRSWYAILVEFQPSSFTRGSYLNVGVNWFWEPREFWAFDLPWPDQYENGLVEYHDDAAFKADFSRMAGRALTYVTEIRAVLTNPKDAFALMSRDYLAENNCWPAYHFGIAAALCRKIEIARGCLARVIASDHPFDWVRQRRDVAVSLLDRLDDQEAFVRFINERIALGRKMKGLPPLAHPALPI